VILWEGFCVGVRFLCRFVLFCPVFEAKTAAVSLSLFVLTFCVGQALIFRAFFRSSCSKLSFRLAAKVSKGFGKN